MNSIEWEEIDREIEQMGRLISNLQKDANIVKDQISVTVEKLKSTRKTKERAIGDLTEYKNDISSISIRITKLLFEREEKISMLQGKFVVEQFKEGATEDVLQRQHTEREQISTEYEEMFTILTHNLSDTTKKEDNLQVRLKKLNQLSSKLNSQLSTFRSQISSIKKEIIEANRSTDSILRKVTSTDVIFASCNTLCWMTVVYRVIKVKKHEVYQDIKRFTRSERDGVIEWYRLREPTSRSDKTISNKRKFDELETLYNEYT